VGERAPDREAVAGRRWRAIGAYAALAAATQLLWLTYAPLTTASAHHYHVSQGAIGDLAEIFPLLYVVLGIPAGRLLDRSFHRWLAVGALLTAAGGLVRLAGAGYGWALAGQLLVATAQPLVLNAVTKLAAEYLPSALRPHGIAVGSAGIFAGMLLALASGTALGGHRIPLLLALQAGFAVLAAAWLCLELARRGAAAAAEREEVAVGVAALRAVWADGGVRVLSALLFLGFGAFIALTTWLQTLLHHYRVSAGAAGSLLAAMVLAGAVGAAVLPPVLVRRRGEQRMIGASILAVVVGGVVLALVHALAVDAIVLIPMGLLLLTDLPVVLELSERRAGAAAGTVTALLWLAGQLGGVVVSLAVEALVHHPLPAFLLLAAVGVCALPLLGRLATLLAADQPASAAEVLLEAS